ncbi:MAG: Tim44/TimA family putative adaptor protein, partial [Pseudolabrys sp.]
AQPTEPVPASERWKGVAAPGSELAAGLDAIASADSDFDAKGFVNGARGAYEMIVSAYAEGDRNTLKSLLSREVYEGFESAIAEREKRGETVESHFISIDEAEITHAEMRQRTAQVTMHFVSKLITATRDKEGKVIDGNAEKVADVTDSWTFARDVTSRDPNWKLVATEAGQ